ncbi:unnamed protein product [Callosobruchus maculatus]|uniref:USP domain-containing protein n=1 Tax=Callosobruchus maculatus TaxID=64391 RepID=A0A653C3L4_CALMS|nr:unnamed protein product [Callosobruchus maculatus]
MGMLTGRYDPTSHQRTKLLQAVKLDREVRLGLHQYELYAAVVHCGSSVDSGHYYTFAKDGAEWFKFNDCSVGRTTAENLCRLKPPETPYILFYSRVDVSEPEALPCTILPDRLQVALTKDHSEYEAEKRQLSQKILTPRRNQNDDPPPPGCGGGGFSATSSNMFVC